MIKYNKYNNIIYKIYKKENRRKSEKKRANVTEFGERCRNGCQQKLYKNPRIRPFWHNGIFAGTIPERIHSTAGPGTIRKNQARSIPSWNRAGFIFTLLREMVRVAFRVSPLVAVGDRQQWGVGTRS